MEIIGEEKTMLTDIGKTVNDEFNIPFDLEEQTSKASTSEQ